VTAALLALLSGFPAHPVRELPSWSVHSTVVYGRPASSRKARNGWDTARLSAADGYRGPGVGVLTVPKGHL
jgi:hypothetical protein